MNPKIVKRPDRNEYSGHRACLGSDKSGMVDSEPVLRHFGGARQRAVEVYSRFVDAALGEPSHKDYYRASDGQLVGGEEFLEEIKHRVGEHRRARKGFERTSVENLLKAAAGSSGLSLQQLSSGARNRKTIAMRDAVIVAAGERGITNRQLAEALGIDGSAVTRRIEIARMRGEQAAEMKRLGKLLKGKSRQ